jgi:hypothetical protein
MTRSPSYRLPHLLALAVLAVACGAEDPAGDGGATMREVEAPVDRSGSGSAWSYMARRHDANKDGRILPDEYDRGTHSFQRLDRDDDGALTAFDFEGVSGKFKKRQMEHNIARGIVSVWLQSDEDSSSVRSSEIEDAFRAYDADDDGRVQRAEFAARGAEREAHGIERTGPLAQLDPASAYGFLLSLIAKEGDESLALGSLLDFFRSQDDGDGVWRSGQPVVGSAQQIAAAGPPVGSPAPDFRLPACAEEEEIRLADLLGRPVVLVFGSLTSPALRLHAGELRGLREEFGERVRFLLVYGREAHALDGHRPVVASAMPIVEEPLTLEERCALARYCVETLDLEEIPLAVDRMDDAVSTTYAPGGAARVFLIDAQGRVAYRGDPGTPGFDPLVLGAAIRATLEG